MIHFCVIFSILYQTPDISEIIERTSGVTVIMRNARLETMQRHIKDIMTLNRKSSLTLCSALFGCFFLKKKKILELAN